MSGSAPTNLPRAGDVIAAKYAIVRVLGEGGMGIVFEASHVRLRQRVAIKMLLPEMLAHPILVERFEREARAAAQLRGRHVARVSDVDATDAGMPYMVMEFLEGWDLQREMESRGPLPFAEAVDYVLQACAAMSEAHAVGIVHRDLKPSNLFLANDGGTRVVKVLDFGISKVSNDRDVKITDAHVVMGTALYMSPEQVLASHAVDARTDIWALGIILYEAVAGRAPFTGTATQIAAAIVTADPPDIRSFAQLPPDLATVLHKTLQREPSNRFSDVRQLAVALAPFAPPGSIGRLYAESLVGTESGSWRSLAAPPPSSGRVLGSADNAPTVMNLAPPPYDSSRNVSSLTPQASARSEARMRPDGTAPGWSQHGVDARKKNRGLLLGAGIAFIIALLAAVGGLLVFSANKPVPSAAPSTTAPPVAADPLPPSLDQPSAPSQPAPPPPKTAEAASATTAPAPPSVKVTTTKPAVAPKPTAAPATPATHAPTTAPAPPAPAPPPASSGAKDKDGKPLFL